MTDSACTILDDLRTRYRGVPILTLAQTALWDDPIKALFKSLVDEHAPGTRMVLGVMDTDYFSRLPRPPAGAPPFDLLPHNDGSTRDLWAAVGEMSCLLGAETPLPLHVLKSHGVSKGQVAAALGGDCGAPECHAFIDAITEAWGWRGIAQTQGRRLLAGNVPLRELQEPLTRQLRWALGETARVAERPLGPAAETLLSTAVHYAQAHPDDSLADLYLALLPLLYQTLMGYAPQGLEYTRSSELLRFNRWTANRVRFRPLDLFLDPRTAAIARRHYNEAVHDGVIATLDRFGPDAVPFDLAIPGHGRGTLHLSDTLIHVDTDEPIDIPLAAPIRNRRHLAVVLEENLGPGAALLGKAVVLITMLAGEYIFLFNETGSPYVPRSCRWNDLLARNGVGLTLYPILRLGVHPWDTVGKAGGHFALPPHMAQVFRETRLSAQEFQEEWRLAVLHAEEMLQTIRRITRPGEWLDYLRREEEMAGGPGAWSARAGEHAALLAERREHGARVRAVNDEGARLLESLRALRKEVNEREIEKGRHFRSCIQPLRERLWRHRHGDAEDVSWVDETLRDEEARRAGIEAGIDGLRAGIARVQAERAALAIRRRALHEDPALAARERRIRLLEGEADRERAQRVRDAYMTAEALRHTQPRPSAWWFPAVDPSGAWFHAVAETATFWWQPLMDGACADPANPLTPDTVLSI
jgi:hypothetical protein